MCLHDEFTPRGIFAPRGKFATRSKHMHRQYIVDGHKYSSQCEVSVLINVLPDFLYKLLLCIYWRYFFKTHRDNKQMDKINIK